MTDHHRNLDPVDPRAVYGGVDTHRDFHVASAVSALGALLGTATFPASTTGYQRLLEWLKSWGTVAGVGVEGTGSYGAGLARYLDDHDLTVHEVNRPDRTSRRRRGKSDHYDAEAAARSVLAGSTHPAKINHAAIESLRMLKLQYDSAVKQRTATLNQMHQIRITAPDALRTQLGGLTKKTLPTTCARFRIDPAALADPTTVAKKVLRGLAKRVLSLTEEINDLNADITTLTKALAPITSTASGVGPQGLARLLITIGENPQRFASEASFAALCGTNPVPANSGQHQGFYRLNPAGNRQANSALHMMVISRLAHHQPTNRYIAQRSPDGKSTPHLRRKLKRYLARELFTLLRTDLRNLHQHPQAA
ncbi:IS110 family transposase [Nocardioides salsibiostraticola]